MPDKKRVDEDVRMYLSESREMLDEVEPYIIEMGKDELNPENHETVNMVFRTFHTIKGSSSFFDFNNVVSLTHQAETLLDKIRSGFLEFRSIHADVLCRTCDVLNFLINQIEKRGDDLGYENQIEQVNAELANLAGVKPSSGDTKEQKIFIIDRNYSVFFESVKETLEELSGECRTFLNKPDQKMNYNYLKQVKEKMGAIKESSGLLHIFVIKELTANIEEFVSLLYDHLEASDHELSMILQSFDMVNVIIKEFESQGSFERIESIVNKYLGNLSDIVYSTREQIADSSEEKEEFFRLNSDMVHLFVSESLDQLDGIEDSLIDYLKSGDVDNLKEILRLVHSFKGGCGFMGYEDPEKITHIFESFLGMVIEKRVVFDDEDYGSILAVITALRDVVKKIAEKEDSSIENKDEILKRLEKMIGSQIEESEEVSEEKEDEKEESKEIETRTRQTLRRDIRVNISKLDELVDLIGELVIAEAMVTNNPDIEGYEMENFERSAIHLNKIVRELQDVALSVRMVPISGIFRRMIRLVHDMGRKSQKKINLRLVGEDTEIDKTVAELIVDPLIHLVRNSIDHGLEPVGERREQSKNDSGELLLEAKHEGNEVWIVVRDDGRGLGKEKIMEKALEKGLVQNNNKLSDSEIYDLIFSPGFSTSDEITEISGRGVGLDVVKRNIENINGKIDVFSYEKKGTMFVIRIPLTLAIIEGMLVRVGSHIYTIPLLSIRESIQVNKEEITLTMDGHELVELREELIPVIRLHELYSIEPENKNIEDGLLVVVEYHKNAFCLFIDEIIGEQQTVVKAISKYIDKVKGISGCTILGDGEVSLILDIGGILARSKEKGSEFEVVYN